MPVNSVYLVIHSQSHLPSSKNKPGFRVVSTELPNLPPNWTGHDHGNYKYTNVVVIASGSRLAEEWKIEIEYNLQEDVEIVGWRNTLEAAVGMLTDSVTDHCNVQQQVAEKENGYREKRVRVTWRDSLDGNSTAFYRIKSNQKNFDGSTSQITTSHWYEIIRVNLEHTDTYDVKPHETARLEYLERSKRIYFLTSKKRTQGLGESEIAELEGLQRDLGYLAVEKDGLNGIMTYVRKSEDQGEGVGEYLRNEILWDSDSDSEDEEKKRRYVDLDVNNAEIMGTSDSEK